MEIPTNFCLATIPTTFVVLQLITAAVGAYLTPVNDCVFGFFTFGLGSVDALMHISAEYLEEGRGTYLIVEILEIIHDYAAVGLMNMELYHLSYKHSLLSVTFCIPMTLNIIAQLFGDADSMVPLMYLKQMNMMAHSMSIGYLARSEFNIWFGGVWLSSLIVNYGIYTEAADVIQGRIVKLFGYILFYSFAAAGIYDDDFLSRLEWFGMSINGV
ncbi:uncharacterized protein [Musca autumnalis]|uniref:uncharacterized protein n=1 Tax=Musca autumnalis TaxID=221902 RepID=UPI003CEABAC9